MTETAKGPQWWTSPQYGSNFVAQGWQCPKCERILAPTQTYCLFCTGKTTYFFPGTTGTAHGSSA